MLAKKRGHASHDTSRKVFSLVIPPTCSSCFLAIELPYAEKFTMLIVRHHLPSLRLFPSGWMFWPESSEECAYSFFVLPCALWAAPVPIPRPRARVQAHGRGKEQPGGFLHSLAFLSPPLYGRREWQLTWWKSKDAGLSFLPYLVG